MKQNFVNTLLKGFNSFERFVTIILAFIIVLITIFSLFRIGREVLVLFLFDILNPENISFEDFRAVFAKILTLLISIEFLNSLIKVLKNHSIKTLVFDVALIAALALGRKLIILDYDQSEMFFPLIIGGVLVCIGVFYFLISKAHAGSSSNKPKQDK